MPRAPSDESGPARIVSVRLSPRHVELLDRLAGNQSLSRSALIARLLERAERGTHPSGAGEPVAAAPPALASVSPTVPGGAIIGQSAEAVGKHTFAINACVHRNVNKLATGIHRCRDCGGTKGMDGVWR